MPDTEKCRTGNASVLQTFFHPGGNPSTENGTIVVANQEMGHILNINERLILNKRQKLCRLP
ncbi:MAG: hypothetical protein ACLTBV_15265 [Enterocloster bolteae]